MAISPLATSIAPRASHIQEDDDGGAVGWLLKGLAGAGNFLDLPGSMVRDTLALKNPFDQLASPFSHENRTSGRDLLRQYGAVGEEDNWGNFTGGLAAEIALDPLMLLSKPIRAAGKGADAIGEASRLQRKLAKPKYRSQAEGTLLNKLRGKPGNPNNSPSKMMMGDSDKPFFDHLKANPDDVEARLIFSDKLKEAGHFDEAERQLRLAQPKTLAEVLGENSSRTEIIQKYMKAKDESYLPKEYQRIATHPSFSDELRIGPFEEIRFDGELASPVGSFTPNRRWNELSDFEKHRQVFENATLDEHILNRAIESSREALSDTADDALGIGGGSGFGGMTNEVGGEAQNVIGTLFNVRHPPLLSKEIKEKVKSFLEELGEDAYQRGSLIDDDLTRMLS